MKFYLMHVKILFYNAIGFFLRLILSQATQFINCKNV